MPVSYTHLGYDRTDYLHAALQNGVHDYLLKPASADKIISSVLKCKEEIVEEQNRKAQKLTRDALLDESIPILQMMLISDLLKGNMEQNKRLVHQSKMLGVPLDGPVFQTMTPVSYTHLSGGGISWHAASSWIWAPGPGLSLIHI